MWVLGNHPPGGVGGNALVSTDTTIQAQQAGQDILQNLRGSDYFLLQSGVATDILDFNNILILHIHLFILVLSLTSVDNWRVEVCFFAAWALRFLKMTMKNLLRHIFYYFLVHCRLGAFVLLAMLPSSPAMATGAPSDRELSTMGQGFGKFVGSFMQQMQSDDGKRATSAEGRLSTAPPPPPVEEPPPVRREREVERQRPREDRLEPGERERRYVPYRTYDPWGAGAWGDPVLGFDPWARGGGWVEHDWNLRKRQYGWSYGGGSPYDRGEYGPYGGGAYPDIGGGAPLRERSWSAPLGGGYGGDGWDRGRYDRWYPPPEMGPEYRSRGEHPPWSSDRPWDGYDRNDWER